MTSGEWRGGGKEGAGEFQTGNLLTIPAPGVFAKSGNDWSYLERSEEKATRDQRPSAKGAQGKPAKSKMLAAEGAGIRNDKFGGRERDG